MKKLAFLISTLLISGLNAQAMTETVAGGMPAAPISMQLAFVDLRVLLGDDLSKTPHEWRDRMTALQREAEERMNKITADAEKYQRLQQEYTTLRSKKGIVDNAAINAKEEELAKLEKDIKIAQQSAQGYTNNMSQQIYADMIGKIEKVVKEIAKARNYLIVFAGPVALYVNPAIDITADVVAELNKQYKPKKETKAPAKTEQKAAAPVGA